MAEQGGDGEPVGEGADHRRLGAGAHVADPCRGVLLVGPGDQVDDRGGDEQPGGERLHPPQVPLPPEIDRRHHRDGHAADATRRSSASVSTDVTSLCTLREQSRIGRQRANSVVVSAASRSHSGKMPTNSVKATAAAIARPDAERHPHRRRARRRRRVGHPGADHDPQVQEGGDDRRHHGDDRQGVAVLVDAGPDDAELGDEPARERHAGLGDEEHRQGERRAAGAGAPRPRKASRTVSRSPRRATRATTANVPATITA